MDTIRYDLKSPNYPEKLRRIVGPPPQLFCKGADLTELLKRPTVAIVGSRLITPYGRKVTQELAARLAEQGVLIISGLALGVDAAAHEATLKAGGLALAVLPSPVSRVAPATNQWLADKILAQGGALVSEYPDGNINHKQNFVARNRIVAGLADALLITEAGEKSGSLHTATFARNQNTDVMVVPGNITNRGSVGTNNLLKSGAHTITSVEDILFILKLNPHDTPAIKVRGRNRNEQTLLDLLLQGVSNGDELLEQSGLDISQFNQTLTMLEISAKIRPLGSNHWSIS